LPHLPKPPLIRVASLTSAWLAAVVAIIALATPGPAAAAPPPWRGSSITVSNVVSLNTLDKSAEPTYNPYYGLQTTFAPRWWLNEQVYLRGSFSLSREFTESDITTQADETVPSDVSLGVGAQLWHIPVVGIDTAAGFDVRLATSPYSQAQTLRFALTPGVSLNRTFPEAANLSLRYSLAFVRNFHDSTTGELDAVPTLGCRSTDFTHCDTFRSTGVRNVRTRVSQGAEIAIEPWSWVSASVGASLLYDYLYRPLTTADATFESQDDQGTRTIVVSSMELAFTPLDVLTVAVSATASNAQRQANQENYALFINRNTELALDLRLDVAALTAPWMED